MTPSLFVHVLLHAYKKFNDCGNIFYNKLIFKKTTNAPAISSYLYIEKFVDQGLTFSVFAD